MNKGKKILLTTLIVTAVGITYAISTFKDLKELMKGGIDEN